jgi:hypothetical protein
MHHRLRHNLGVAQAHQLMDDAFATYARRHAKHAPTLTWFAPDRARLSIEVLGALVWADVFLTPRTLEIEAQVPWSLRMFSRAAIRVIDDEAQAWLRPPSTTVLR